MASKQYQGCVLAVVDSEFRVISPNWVKNPRLEVMLPWTLESLKILVFTHVVSSDMFGATGIN